jgi:glycosyltransferase involved in cell wall biosynthesis
VGDGPERESLEASAGDGVRFMGFLSEADKRRVLAEAWLLVHSAMHEGWGMVIMEAAASGTPSIGFNVFGVRDSILDGRTGILVLTTEEFEAAWIRLAQDTSARARLGAAARSWAAELTWDRAVDAFLAVFEEARTSGGRPRRSVKRAELH